MSELLALVGLVLVVVLIALLIAPFESLGWWAGWFGRRDELEREVEAARQSARAPTPHSGDDCYVVFLSGIGAISGEELLPTEKEFLELLDARLPQATVVTDVFPYAAGGTGLTGHRLFARLWRLLYRMRIRGGSVLTNLVNLRNLFQVLVSADSRYGPVFNYGTSRQVVLGLLRAGYRPEDRRPVFLLGSSGGGQIAVGASPYLMQTLGAPVEVVSLGGVISSDPGLRYVDHLTHIHGTIDGIQALGGRVFPSRWPTSPGSDWNRALHDGRIEKIDIGHIKHQGVGGYLDGTTRLPEGDTPRERTLATIAGVVERRTAAHRSPGLDGCPLQGRPRARPPEEAPRSVRDKTIRTGLTALALLAGAIAVTALVVPLGWAVALWLGGIAVLLAVAAVLPVSTSGLVARPQPCPSYDEAIARLDAGPRTREAEGIHPTGHTRLWDHGRRTADVAILWHGLSNSPQSLVALGPQLHARGWTVLAPRMPEHGLADLATDALRRLTAEELRDAADEAVDIAAGLGERITVVGISGGGVVAAWSGQFRTEVDRAVLLAPAFGLASFGPVVNRFLMRVMLLVPSISIWKDPQLKADYPGLGHNYKRMHTRGVGQMSRLGLAVTRAARDHGPGAASAAVVLNGADKAIDPAMARELADAWSAHIPVDRHEFPPEAGLGHEIVDPADPEGDVEVTYPVLLALIDPVRTAAPPAAAHPAG